jgi:hypothetical protein
MIFFQLMNFFCLRFGFPGIFCAEKVSVIQKILKAIKIHCLKIPSMKYIHRLYVGKNFR